MKKLQALFTGLLFLLCIGCSGGGKASTPIQNPDNPVLDSEYAVLLSGTMDLENETVKINERAMDWYYNVTGFVGSNFYYSIDGFTQPDILEITLNIHNVSQYNVHDVVLVFEDTYGKIVMNPDGSMDIFDPGDLDPFIAFMKHDPDRYFPSGVLDQQPLRLRYPSGQPAIVDFFILAHLPGNTGGVMVVSDWEIFGNLTPTGSVNVQVAPYDHQGDVTEVVADTSIFTGGLTPFSPLTYPYWGATIHNTNNVGPGVYNVLVKANSPSAPPYSTYNTFELEVVPGGNYQVTTDNFVEMPRNDVWYDIGVQAGGFVYVCADHPDTDNVGLKRTAIRYENDFSGMTVLNSEYGMNDPYSVGYLDVWDRMDVTRDGMLVTNPGLAEVGVWYVESNQANINACYYLLCGYDAYFNLIADIWNHWDNGDIMPGPSGMGYADFGATCSQPVNENAGAMWLYEPGYPGWGGVNSLHYGSGPPLYEIDSIKGIDGVMETPNCVFLISNAQLGKLSLSGDWVQNNLVEGTPTPAEIDYIGTLGTDDAQFKGGLDVSIDLDGNILTLEDHGGGAFRFQKFDAGLNWIYTAYWQDEGSPMRMDFDTDKNTLYLLSNIGIHECQVD